MRNLERQEIRLRKVHLCIIFILGKNQEPNYQGAGHNSMVILGF